MLPGAMAPAWMVELERNLAGEDDTDELATALIVLATIAGQDVRVEQDEQHGAGRRALLLLSAGGDPSRGLDLNGHAVEAIANDLRTAERQLALETGLRLLRLQAEGLPHISEALHGLMHAPDLAWRAYAAGVLAGELGGDD
jgi:hypothetical protein